MVVARDGAKALVDYLFGSGRDGAAALPSVMVLLSANDGISDVRCAYRSGASGFVSKLSDTTLPFHELVPLVVRYWLYTNTPAIGLLPGPTTGSL